MPNVLEDGTLSFLPTRLNSQPVVIGGLSADEMWITLLLTSTGGLILGTTLAILTQVWALIIPCGLAGGALGLSIASKLLRRWKRGKPDTWLYRRLQLSVAEYLPTYNTARLITHTGAWTCRRTEGA